MPRRQEPQNPPPAMPARKGDPEAIAKVAMGRRAVGGRVRVAVTLPVETAQTLAARAIREEKNLEQLLGELIERAAR